MKGPSSRIVWNSPSWRLRSEEVVGPDGVTVEKRYIEHPGAVALIPLRSENEILMLRQYRRTVERSILELPAGTRGWEEPWLDCAQRELREETGYQAATFTPLGRLWPAPGYSDEVMALYLARGLTLAPLSADFDEIIELQPMALDELVIMARDGGLEDGKSIVGVLRAAAHLGRAL